nr:hypothetical protein [Tanacetum cinerariifolium]
MEEFVFIKYDTNLNSLNFSDYHLQPQYEMNSCELCGNDAHYGYDFPPQVPFVYNQNSCFDQNFDNSFPLTSPNSPQQNLVCENCRFVNHQPQEIPEVIPFIEIKEWIETKNKLYKMMEVYTKRMNQQREQEALLAAQREQELQKELYCVHDSIEDLIGMAMNTMLFSINFKSQRLGMEKQEVKNIVEQATKRRTRITESLQNFTIIHKKSSISLNNTSQISPVIANIPELPTEEPEDSLSIGDEHLSTIPKMESDEVIKSSVKNLVPIPSESEVISDNESECDVPVNDESSPSFTTFSNPLFDCNDDFTSSDDKSLSNEDVLMENFKIYSNPIFDDEEIISTKIDLHYFNVESNLLESLLNRDTLIDSSPKFDYLPEEFSGELAHINPIPPRIEEADFDLEEEIRLVENLFDSHMEEIDLFLATDDLTPSGIKNDYYDSERDIYFLEEFLSNDPLLLLKNKSSNFDHHDDPSFPRPPPEPPDFEVFFDFEPDTGVLTTNVVKVISEHYVLMPSICPAFPPLLWIWTSNLLMIPSDPETRFSIKGYSLKSNPRDFYHGRNFLSHSSVILFIQIALDLEASRARGFVHRPLELQSLAYGNPIS